MNIKCFVLNNGQELIAELKEETSEVYIVENPVSLVLVPSNDGHVGMQMVPYLSYSSTKTKELNKTNIFITFEPIMDLHNRYSQMFGSGITVAGPDQLNLLRG